MQPHDPSIPEQHRPFDDGPSLPTLELPPVPFARTAAAASAVAMPVAAQPTAEQMPSGTSISDLLGALSIDGVDGGDTLAFLDTPDAVAAPMPVATMSEPDRPLHEFSVAVDRRNRRERRRDQRTTPDRRTFTSRNLAAPASGPADPRPTGAPVHAAPGRAEPIDAVMPALPLEPAVPYQLPNPGVSAQAVRSSRASLAVTELPFPAHAIEHPPAPLAAPAPPTQQQVDAVMAIAPAQSAPVAPAAPTPAGIESIFDATAQSQVGHLVQRQAPDAHVHVHVPIPDAGPAGPASSPAAGLDPVAATVAAAPGAWYGGAVQVDDSMMIWNAPGTDAPLAPSVASMISPAPPTASAAASPAAVATTPLAPAAAAAAAAGAANTRRAGSRSWLRLALIVGIPASAGVGLAFAIDRFLL